MTRPTKPPAPGILRSITALLAVEFERGPDMEPFPDGAPSVESECVIGMLGRVPWEVAQVHVDGMLLGPIRRELGGTLKGRAWRLEVVDDLTLRLTVLAQGFLVQARVYSYAASDDELRGLSGEPVYLFGPPAIQRGDFITFSFRKSWWKRLLLWLWRSKPPEPREFVVTQVEAGARPSPYQPTLGPAPGSIIDRRV